MKENKFKNCSYRNLSGGIVCNSFWLENLMIKKIFILFKLGRKLAKSDILNIVSKFKKPPIAIKILFQILSFSFSSSKKLDLNENEGARLSKSIQSYGNYFH